MIIVDERLTSGPGGYTLTQVRHTAGHTLRVRIRRDHYSDRSYALVEVLTPGLTWTVLAGESATAWHALLPAAAAAALTTGHLQVLANQLIHRAVTILTPPGPPTTPDRGGPT